MRDWLAALVIVTGFVAGAAATAFVMLGGPWWVGALVVGGPALAIRLVLTVALLRGPSRKDRS